MTVEQLARHNGESEEHPIYTSVCGYIFQHKEVFRAYHGRDVTFRNVLHARGINMDANDDGGKSHSHLDLRPCSHLDLRSRSHLDLRL